ncbi:MAG: hypothetical protein SFY56_15050 [Bacteroidota bacterium]|nr:hypothetical protein [Bacteroidota bacterium]
MISLKNILVFSIGSLLLASCGGEEKPHDGDVTNDSANVVTKDTTPVTVDDTTKFKFDFAIANIPSPANSVQELAGYGVAYNSSFLNDSKKVNNYSSEFQRAINLGVYNIDMSYAMVNDKGEDVLKYMKNVMQISDKLGLKSAVDVMVGKRAETNISNKDSLFKILDEIFVKSDSYLRTNERVYTAGTIFAGSWLESLYLTCKMGQNAGDNTMAAKVHNHLWEQRFHLGNLINLLGDYKDKKECVDLVADLKPIHAEITAVKQPKDMDDTQFNAIATKIFALRDKLTK